MNFPNNNGKQMEWLHYIVASQFEKHKADSTDEAKLFQDDMAGVLFSAIVAFSVVFFISDWKKALILPVGFLFSYYILYKLIVSKFLKFLSKEIKKHRGYQIPIENKQCRDKVFLFNGILTNQVVLATDFLDRADQIEDNCLKEYYYIEALHYLKNPVDQIHLIAMDKELCLKILNDDINGIYSGKTIRLYRFLKVCDLIGRTLEKIKVNNIVKDELFFEDITNSKAKIDKIIVKLKEYGMIS